MITFVAGVPYQQTQGGAVAGYPTSYQSNGGVDTSGVTLAPPPYTPHAITSITEDEEPEETGEQTLPGVHTTRAQDNNAYHHEKK